MVLGNGKLDPRTLFRCWFRARQMERKVNWAKLLKLIQGLWLGAIWMFPWIWTSPCLGQEASFPDSRRQAALAFEQADKLTEAEAEWRAILVSRPSDVEGYAHLGLLEARQQHYKDAIFFYRKALKLNSNFPGLRFNLGLSLFKSGDLHAAVQTFQFLLNNDPSSPDAVRLITLIGLAHYGLGEYPAAASYLRQAMAHDPTNLPFRLMLAQSCLRSRQYQCVLDVYQEILKLNAESAEADMLAGEAYDELKNDAGALAQFEAAVKADPKAPDVYFGYGYLLWRVLKFDQAEKAFRSELENNPEHPLALAYLGDTEIHLNRSGEAVPYLKRAVKLQPSVAIAHLDLGIIYQDERREDDALREFQVAERLSPDDPSIHWRLGRLYQSMGKKLQAQAEFDKTRNMQQAKQRTLQEQMRQVDSKPGGDNAETGSR
jgi:tetratricopeptide (TPR) repeat protein